MCLGENINVFKLILDTFFKNKRKFTNICIGLFTDFITTRYRQQLCELKCRIGIKTNSKLRKFWSIDVTNIISLYYEVPVSIHTDTVSGKGLKSISLKIFSYIYWQKVLNRQRFRNIINVSILLRMERKSNKVHCGNRRKFLM